MTNAINETFGRPRVLLPVIHACSDLQAMRQARLAHELGADGVFLINQGGLEADGVVSVARSVADTIPGWFVGVNLLGVSSEEAEYLLEGHQLSGLWDDAVDPDSINLCRCRSPLGPVALAARRSGPGGPAPAGARRAHPRPSRPRGG